MEQRISLITLGVASVERARVFYEQLGWSGQQTERTVFFQAGGAIVTLWGRDELAVDAGLPADPPNRFGGVCLAHNVRTPGEVDQIMQAAERAGGVVTKPAQRTFYGGYAGVFTDPDGHPWEIAHNPGFAIAEDGSIVLPDFDAE